MAKEEKEIDAENDLYEKGKANFKEALNEWSDVPKAEFEKEREGYVPNLERIDFPEEERSFGYIHDENLENTPEEIDELDEIYSSIDRASLPAKWDSRTLGKYSCINKSFQGEVGCNHSCPLCQQLKDRCEWSVIPDVSTFITK